MNLLETFAQYTTYEDYSSNYTTSTAVDPGVALFFNLLWLLVVIFYIVVMWRIFTKANQAGWKAIIPFYNVYVLSKYIVGAPSWFAVLSIFFSPLVIITMFFLARSFGKSTGFAVCNVFFNIVTLPMLAFGNAKYVGPSFDHHDATPIAPTTPSTPPTPSATQDTTPPTTPPSDVGTK
jgi:hypothetical protein